MYQSLAHPYVSLAQAFELDDMEGFKAEVDAGEGIWQLVSHLPSDVDTLREGVPVLLISYYRIITRVWSHW